MIQANDIPAFILYELGEEIVVVALAIHHVNRRAWRTKSVIARLDGTPPTKRLAGWIAASVSLVSDATVAWGSNPRFGV